MSEQPIEFGHQTPPPRKVIGPVNGVGVIEIESGRVLLLGIDPPTSAQIPESFYQLHIARTIHQIPF